jgi:hypothetical protein
VGSDGTVRVERGFVRPEDEPETKTAKKQAGKFTDEGRAPLSALAGAVVRAAITAFGESCRRRHGRPGCQKAASPFKPSISYCVVKIDFGIMPWMPFVPSTTWVTW